MHQITSHSKMKTLKLKQEILLNKIKNIFQHPSGYVSIVHRQDNKIILYDQMTMNIILSSNQTLNEHIKFIVFTHNFNVFYAYCHHQENIIDKAKLYKFQQDHQYKLICTKYLISKNQTPTKLKLLGLTNIQSFDHKNILLGWNHTSYYFISQVGEVVKQNKFIYNKQQFKIDLGQVYKSNILLIVCQDRVILVTIDLNAFTTLDIIKFKYKVIRFHLQIQSNPQYLLIVTQQSTFLTKINNFSFTNLYKLQIGNILSTKICILTPGVDVSSTNSLKNKLFLVYQGKVEKKQDERNTRQQMGRSLLRSSNNISKNQQKYFYITQFTINNHQAQQNTIKILKPNNIFNILYEIHISDILYNEHDMNCIRILTSQNNLARINLYAIYQNPFIGQQWTNLSFQLKPIPKPVHFQQEEAQFQIIMKENKEKLEKIYEISQHQLNDWSFCVFSNEELKNLKNNRVKIPFD